MGTERYVLTGIYFFITHPKLYRLVVCPLLATLVWTVLSLALLFGLAYVPQAHALINAGLNTSKTTWLAWTISVGLVLVETAASVIIFSAIAFARVQDLLFEETLKIQGVPVMSKETCFELRTNFTNTTLSALLFLVTLPLNILPILGSVGFALINGCLKGWSFHEDYFSMKGLTWWEQYYHVKDNYEDYLRFGAMGTFLGLIPGLNLLCIFTNYVGAALWAADMDSGKTDFITRNPEKWKGIQSSLDHPGLVGLDDFKKFSRTLE
eukprot:TRINITY_DN12514_c0_g1_i1.p1 TRINITY_DN12514_c0_g1~~TRINITY_DN12514_c0_g1_i1.p1  ORF type:complete len:266 (-),score=28.26 TRINITY_DN12514_c0_g1_i1:37-834(-)